MRIIEITGEPILHGGQEKFISNLIAQMEPEQYQIDVLTPYHAENEAFLDLVKSKGGEVFQLGFPFTPGKSRKNIYDALIEFFQDHTYDVAHIHSGSTSVLAYASQAAKESGIGKVIVHSHCEGESSIKHRLITMLYGGKIKNNATDFWACSQVAGVDKFPASVCRDRMVLISNGIDIDEFKPDDQKRKEYREKTNIPEDAFVMGTVGRFSYQKNTEYLINVFHDVHNRVENSYLLLVGDGELRKDIEEQIHRLGEDESVILTGNVDNVPDYLQVMDAFLLPSRYEGLPFVALEAQAAGLPTLVSTGVTEEVVIGDEVSMIPLEDYDQWVEQAVSSRGKPRVDNKRSLTEAGYNINDTAALVKRLYSS